MQLGVGGAGMNLGGSSPGGSGTGGSAQTGMGGSAPGGNGGSGNPPDGCPDDVTELFRRPGTQGGCEGGSCHSPGSPIAPDLVSPNVLERLLDEPSTCQGRPYIGAGDSVIADKISDSPDCGSPMPLLTPQALSAADEQCILDWIEEVAAGG